MSWKESLAYVQKKINDILKAFPFARVYIDNVVIFNNTLKKHLRYFNQIFELFQSWNIILKTTKTYFDYFNISLLSQKINNFELATTTNKLKIITKLEFSKNLKALKKYFEVIKYFKNYILYYAQKSKALNKKTKLLRNDSNKKTARKNFSKKILFEHLLKKELKSYWQLQKNFSRSN